MPIKLSDAHRKLLDGKNFAFLATIGEDGEPQNTPVWIEYDGTNVSFNTEESRAKVKHMRANPLVAICVMNAENPYEYVEIRGNVVEMTRNGADEQINRLSHLYLGKDYPFNKPGDVRLTVNVAPEKALGMNND